MKSEQDHFFNVVTTIYYLSQSELINEQLGATTKGMNIEKSLNQYYFHMVTLNILFYCYYFYPYSFIFRVSQLLS